MHACVVFVRFVLGLPAFVYIGPTEKVAKRYYPSADIYYFSASFILLAVGFLCPAAGECEQRLVWCCGRRRCFRNLFRRRDERDIRNSVSERTILLRLTNWPMI